MDPVILTPASKAYKRICAQRVTLRPCPDLERWCTSTTSDTVSRFDASKMYIGEQHAREHLGPLLTALPSLTTIDLTGLDLKDDVMMQLCTTCFVSHPGLRTLVLDRNPGLTLVCSQSLVDLTAQNPNITSVSLEATNVSPVARAKIQLQVERNVTCHDHAPRLLEYAPSPYQAVSALQLDEEWDMCTNAGDILDGVERLREGEDEDCDNSGQLHDDPDAVPEAPSEKLATVSGDVAKAAADSILKSMSYGSGVLSRCDNDNNNNNNNEGNDDTARQWVDDDAGILIYDADFRLTDRLSADDGYVLFLNPKHPRQPRAPDDLTARRGGVRALLNALCVLCQHPQYLRDVFVRAHLDVGLFELRLYREGRWQHVLVDNRVPCESKRIRTHDRSEIWATLIEKAYAKIAGGYRHVALKSTAVLLTELTGGCVHTHVITTQAQRRECIKDDALWSMLRGYMGNGFIISVLFRATSRTQVLSLRQMGYEANRTYTIVEMYDGSVVLQNIESDDTSAPPILDVEFAQLVSLVSKIYVLRPPDAFRGCSVSKEGEWVIGRNAGGNHLYHYHHENPTYRVRVATASGPPKARDTRLYIELTTTSTTCQPVIYIKGMRRTPHSVRSHVVALEVNIPSPSREIDVVVCTEKPNVAAGYTLRFATTRNTFVVDEVPTNKGHVLTPQRQVIECSADGAWSGDIDAGGHPWLVETFLRSPQYRLEVGDDGRRGEAVRAEFVLSVDPSDATAPGYFVGLLVVATQSGGRLREAPNLSDASTTRLLTPFQTVVPGEGAVVRAVNVALDAGSSYIAIPMTWRAGRSGKFKLSAYVAGGKATLQLLKSFA
eukprot:PhM_4_TR13213/c0_g1_i1/m.2417